MRICTGEILVKAREYFSLARAEKQVQGGWVYIRWSISPSGWFKLNSDGSVCPSTGKTGGREGAY